jgi:hypothetical protein
MKKLLRMLSTFVLPSLLSDSSASAQISASDKVKVFEKV